MKPLSQVQHNLREKFFHDALIQSSNALELCNQSERDFYLLTFWKIVAAAVISSTDLDIVNELETLKKENPSFDYAVISVLVWIEESKQENNDPNFMEKLLLLQTSSEKSACVQGIILAAEFFIYVERVNQAAYCLFKIHHQMYQVTEPNDILNDLFRVSAWLYVLTDGSSQAPSDKFEKVLKRDNKLDLDCILSLGKYHAYCKEKEKANDLFYLAVEYDGSYFPAYLELSKLLFLSKDFEGALHFAEKATLCCDGDLTCIYHSVVVNMQLGKYEAGRKYLNMIMKEILKHEIPIHPQFSEQLCMTVCQISNYDMESIELCIGLMAHICESDPENTELRLDFAQLLRCARRYDEATSLYEFISSFDDNLEALEGLLLTNALKGNPEEAKQQLELYYLLAENDKSSKLDTVLAKILIPCASFAEAIDAISEHFEQNFNSDQVAINIDVSTIVLISKTILFTYRFQLPSNIQKLLNVLLKISERYFNHDFVLVVAKIQLELDQVDDAMKTITNFLKYHPSSQSMRLLKAHVFLSMGDIENARINIKEIIDKDATYQDDLYFKAINGWIQFLEHQGDEGKLILKPLLFESNGRTSRQTWGDRKRCLLFYGHSNLNDEELLQLLPIVESEAKHSKCFELTYLLSQLEVRSGSIQKAIQVLDNVPKTSSDYKRAQHAKALIVLNKKQDKHGFLEVFKTIAKEEKSLMSFVNLGRAHLQIGNHTEALSSYRHALSLQAEDEDTAIMICNDILDNQKFDIAIDFCRHHLDDAPQHLRIKLLMARIPQLKGDWIMSLNVYNDILSEWDDSVYSVLDKIDIQKAAASIYHGNGEIELALELLCEARDLCSILISDSNDETSLQTELFQIQVNISNILMAEKNFIQAMTSLKEALKLGGSNDINVLKMIAVSCFKCKLYDECDLYCQQVLAMDPNDEDGLLLRHCISSNFKP